MCFDQIPIQVDSLGSRLIMNQFMLDGYGSWFIWISEQEPIEPIKPHSWTKSSFVNRFNQFITKIRF